MGVRGQFLHGVSIWGGVGIGVGCDRAAPSKDLPLVPPCWGGANPRIATTRLVRTTTTCWMVPCGVGPNPATPTSETGSEGGTVIVRGKAPEPRTWVPSPHIWVQPLDSSSLIGVSPFGSPSMGPPPASPP
nr:hypothetical protein Itr_chr12CG20650 [Ipomoea trifida]